MAGVGDIVKASGSFVVNGAISYMAPQQSVEVKIEGARVNVEGRVLDGSHFIIAGASEVEGEVGFEPSEQETEWGEKGLIRVTLKFGALPQVEMEEEVIKVTLGAMPDFTSSSDVRFTELEEGYEVQGDRLTVKFEVDEDSRKVILKVPRLGSLKASRLRIGVKSEASINIVLRPIIMGAISFRELGRARLIVSDSEIVLTNTEVSGEAKEAAVQSASESAAR